MGTGAWILLVVVGLAVTGRVGVWLVQRRLRRFARANFGTDTILEGVQRERERLAETPKSISAMTGVYLPQIEQDFPEFSLDDLKCRSENLLRASLEAVERQNAGLLADASPDLKEQIRLWIEDDRAQGVREQFHNVLVHRTEITRYQKLQGYCRLVLQSAVEFRYAKVREGEQPKPERIQTRYDQEWLYVQDAELLPEGTLHVAVNCPNCGAPVRNLGAKHCEYCGTAVVPVNIHAWALKRIQKNV